MNSVCSASAGLGVSESVENSGMCFLDFSKDRGMFCSYLVRMELPRLHTHV